MRIIIIEDEIPALEKIERYILKYNSSYRIVARLASVKEAVLWLQDPDNLFDIAFMDIQLSDGLSFEIFEEIPVKSAIIFTTAYNHYAIEAFKLNAVDYLLKPVSFERFTKGINNFLQHISENDEVQATSEKSTKEREFIFLKADKKHHKINIADILYFESFLLNTINHR